MAIYTILTIISSLLALSNAQSSFSPARPPAIPLAVKSPYLSTWLGAGSNGGNGGYLAGEWPRFWTGTVTAWTGLIRVDGESYIWMGQPVGFSGTDLPLVNQTSFEYTATRSIYQQNVNNQVGITVTFLSPITPDDYVTGSLISSYMDVQVSSLDGQTHEVQLYTDISAEWISGDRSAVAQWEYGVNNDTPSPTSTATGTVYPTTTASEASNIRPFGTQLTYEGWTTLVTHTTIADHHQNTQTPEAAVKRQASATTTDSVPATPTGVGNTTSTGAGITGNATSTSAGATGTDAPDAACTGGSASPVETNGIAFHKVYRQTQLAFSEVSDQTEYGFWYYLTANTTNLSHQSGQDTVVRGAFADDGVLANTADTNYRAINNDYPVFAYAHDLGCVGDQNASVLFTINLNQQDAIVFDGADGNATLPSLWASYFSSDIDADVWFYNQYAIASGVATTFDNKVASDSVAAGGNNYNTITSLAARQAFGALQLVNTPETPYLFMKEISSDGNVNTVDVIFPWHPISIYTNPTLLKLVLEPLFINQEAGRWPFAFSIHDIGSRYPNATGHEDGNAEQQPLEECGNMLIMSLAYAQRTNDNAWLQSHYQILKQWNEYLVEEALIPANQISTDDFAGSLANQTNLAIKGIIGIEAMAQIANRTGHAADGANYTAIAHDYISQWLTLANAAGASPPHTTLNYGNASSWGLLYNLFADRELGLSLVPQSVYDQQSAFYPTVADTYGVPLDTRHSYTKNDWELFVAAVASDDTKMLFVDDIATWIGETPTDLPLTDLYDAVTGDFATGVTFTTRPVVGGHFALLALDGAPTDGFFDPADGDTSQA